jgi:hypothetical protein
VGGVYREIRVELDDARMAALRVSALDVSRQLRQVQKEAPGGRGDVSGAEQSVRTIATVQTAAELAAIDLPLPDGRRVRLDQVATVTDTVAEPRAVALQDGKPVVGFEIFRTKGASETEVAKGARAAIAELQRQSRSRADAGHRQRLPGRGKLRRLDGAAVRRRHAGRAGGVVVPARLARHPGRRRRAALSVMPAFLGIYLFGYAQHRDAAVAGPGGRRAGGRRHRRDRKHRAPPAHGQDPDGSGLEAADEIGMAVIATTFALVAVFLPTAFMSGIPACSSSSSAGPP